MKPFFILVASLCLFLFATALPAQPLRTNPRLEKEFQPILRPLQQTTGNTTATGTSSAFNPAISVNGLFLGFYTSGPFTRHPAFEEEHDEEEHDEEEHDEEEHDEEEHDEEEHDEEEHDEEEHDEEGHAHGLPENTGMSVQEVEVRFTAFVDAYLKADLTLAIPGVEGLEVEEAVLSTVSLPNITLSAGKLYAPFGKHNSLHTHAYPFIDPPIANEKILGGEGLNEIGFGANILLPASWYSELTAQVLNGDNELFSSPKGEDLAFVGRWKNLWDLNDATTLELSGSYGTGKNTYKELTHLLGGDLTVKWRPLRHSRDRGITFQTEYLQARINDGLDTRTAGGLYTLLQIQTARRWWVQGRYDVFGLPKLEPEREYRFSGLLAFAPSEFSAIRLQYNLNREDGQNVHQLALQLNFTLGAHPAHSY